MGYNILKKLFITITIVAIAVMPAVSGNNFKDQNDASGEEMQARVGPKIEPQAHFKEQREMEDDRIHLNLKAAHVRNRRQISIEQSSSSKDKNSCNVEPDVQNQLVEAKKSVKKQIDKRQDVEKQLIQIVKETLELKNGSIVRNTICELEKSIKKTVNEGNAQLESEKKKANEIVSALQNEIDLLNQNKSSIANTIIELKAQRTATSGDVAGQEKTNDLMRGEQKYALQLKQSALTRNNNCVKLDKDLEEINKDYDSKIEKKQRDIDAIEGIIGNLMHCCYDKGCDSG